MTSTDIVFRRLTTIGCRFLSTNSGTSAEYVQGKSHGFKNEEGEPFNIPLEEDNHGNQEESEAEVDTKHRILEASLPFVPQHGWTNMALAAGAAAEGLPSVAHGMFPRGGAHLVSFFYQNCNKELAAKLKAEVESRTAEDVKPSTRVFIHKAVETRLKMITPHLDNWHQAMALQTLPENVPEAWTNVLHLMDDIWYYAGDRSVDFNWYTKRVSLAGVYKSTEIYMIQDKSEDLQATWEFLNNRLENLITLGKYAQNAQQVAGISSDTLTGLMKVGKNVLGLNFKSR